MKDLLNFINDNSNCKYEDLQFFGAIYSKPDNLLEVIFNSINKYNDEQLNNLKQLVLQYIENKCDVKIKVKKVKFSLEMCHLKIKDVITNNPMYTMVFDIEKIVLTNKNEKTILINLSVDKNFDLSQRQNFEKLVNFKLSSLWKFDLEYSYTEKLVDYSRILSIRKEEIEQEIENNSLDFTCKISKQKLYLGKMENVSSAMMIENVKAEEGHVVVAGYIKNIRNISRIKNDETKREINFVKFELYNDVASIDCVCFLKLSKDLLTLQDGTQVVVKADVDNYNNNLSLKIMGLSLCNITFPVLPVKKVNKNYKLVKPIPYIAQEQVSFLDKIQTIKNEYLLNNTFVVFDLETTGLDTNTCNIVEIGAVKIVDGVITEQFSTFVNPEEHIPEDATKTNNITDDMVKDAPIIKDVLPDFIKFIENSTLVAHNIAYDYPIINRFAKKFGYILTNERQDTMLLAQKHLGQLKHFKLNKVCEFLGVSLVGAHRAVNDTIATAKVFIKLIENYQNN